MSELSGLSKAEILDIRKKAVNNSIIFSDELKSIAFCITLHPYMCIVKSFILF